jgi:fucose 4-O-acetylase-like acetyltransferase
MKARLYFMDNMRTFLIFLVVILHSGLVYESVLESSWIVVDPDKADGLGLLRMYLDIFVMFSLFFVSGYFTYPSIKKLPVIGFIKSKVKRLMIPWLFGVLFIIPLYKILFLSSRGLPQEKWYTYFHIFQRSDGNPYFYADNPVQNWLWFLPILFSFQLIYLLLVSADITLKKFSIRLMVGLIVIIGLIYCVSISQLDLVGWHHSALFHFQRERLLPYFLVFLLGTIAYHQQSFLQNILNKKLYIWTNLLLTPFLGIFTIAALNLFFNLIDPERNYYFISKLGDVSVYYLSLLLSMLSILYILLFTFHRYFNQSSKLKKVLSNNSYYVYIIHVVVIGALAIPLLSIELPPVIKFFILSITAFIISNVIVFLFKKYLEVYFSNLWIKLLLVAIASFVIVSVFQSQQVQNNLEKINVQENYPSIYEAAMSGNLEALRFHIDDGTNLDIPESSGGASPLIIAGMFGHYDFCQKLIDEGVEINSTNNEGSTALFTAAFFGRKDIVELLLSYGADTDVRDKNGSTAIEALNVPFAEVKDIYAYFKSTYGPMGFVLDYVELEKNRTEIAKILSNR